MRPGVWWRKREHEHDGAPSPPHPRLAGGPRVGRQTQPDEDEAFRAVRTRSARPRSGAVLSPRFDSRRSMDLLALAAGSGPAGYGNHDRAKPRRHGAGRRPAAFSARIPAGPAVAADQNFSAYRATISSW